ncbi:MAG: hypothetical protein ABUL58_02840 [Steroidobacter sp.]
MNRQSDVTSVTNNTQQLLQGVLSATDELVADALKGRWSKVLDGVEQRRRVMQNLVETGQVADTNVAALEAAVTESEQAIMRVVAHAIASSRWSGALYGLHS